MAHIVQAKRSPLLIEDLAASCAGAIEQYQMQNGMPVTGTITPELLTALGIQANFQ